MKQFLYLLLLINLTAQAQGIKKHPQAFSDKKLLAKLISEKADNGLAVVMDLSTNKIIQEPFEKVMAPDSIQILLSANMKYYHHLEDSISKLRRDAFEKDSNYIEQVKTFIIDGKKYTGYDGGALGYYMKACWTNAQEIIKKFMPITKVSGCGNQYDYKSQNRNVNYYNCELDQKNYTRSNASEPIMKSKNYYIYFYDK